MRHERTPIHHKADRFAQFDAQPFAVGAVAVNRLSTGSDDIGDRGCGQNGKQGNKKFHDFSIVKGRRSEKRLCA